jgi:2-iminobutanoate/2-iminopropanoate deaminase
VKQISSQQVPPAAGPYSAGMAAGGLLFLAGQGPFDARGERVGETFADQVRQVFANLAAVAGEAGTSLDRTVRLGVYLRSLDDFEEFNAVSKEFLSEPYPARTTIEAALRGFDVEVDAVVELPGLG